MGGELVARPKWTKGELRFAIGQLDGDDVFQVMAQEILQNLYENEREVRIDWNDDADVCESCDRPPYQCSCEGGLAGLAEGEE